MKQAIQVVVNRMLVNRLNFTVRGQPIVCTPLEAMEFAATELDSLVIENYLIEKNARSSQ